MHIFLSLVFYFWESCSSFIKVHFSCLPILILASLLPLENVPTNFCRFCFFDFGGQRSQLPGIWKRSWSFRRRRRCKFQFFPYILAAFHCFQIYQPPRRNSRLMRFLSYKLKPKRSDTFPLYAFGEPYENFLTEFRPEEMPIRSLTPIYDWFVFSVSFIYSFL